MPALPSTRLRAGLRPLLTVLPLLLAATSCSVQAEPAATSVEALPAGVRAALERARIEPGALSAWVAPAEGGEARLALRPAEMAAPASVMKLVTGIAALDRLGPVFQWPTTVLAAGPDRILRGSGDPRLTAERLAPLLRQAMDAGGATIDGDLILDRSAYALPAHDPAAFDGQPLRPYNVGPDALMVAHRSVMLTLRPDPTRGVARIAVDLPLAGVQWPETVPLAGGDCQDWRAQLAPDFADLSRPRLTGSFPATCGERSWPVAFPDPLPAGFAARAIEAQWRALGGRLQGRVREGLTPAGATVLTEWRSPVLPEVLRDMNKHSNNMIAQQVLLALAPGQPAQPATFEAARAEVQALALARGCREGELVIDNGSGLSRQERITPRCLGRLLQWAWRQPWMPELLASLPVAGIETTARRMTGASGRAHLKTGTLDGVAAIAGYVHGDDGRRHALVAILNHPKAGGAQARAVLDEIVRWAADDLSRPGPHALSAPKDSP
ncbi:D-alanyl-D-alanine carboxypeptidase/D-alanyl-D-alanine-endopeptidase [Sphaerotilus natans subsp. natans DSM 6575]|uniref:D-alanyl-D-alanine carboxypeptidase/D-alanyl-D-alanine-endopeptidase n=1 Tax=Sphaerotilus natans subsp. natans DSM 6575 TaxID=1286631 RepID=A0A059KI78_9BURK|nr:D-alanyl-D-alanine carboxypeptidase/D-alanyl-D-alanine-endopeptidase [Sphaerotilus natans]KDB50823.1 D-alanyl-D-alanine carboxypeptidase/D-alanyl-D-alanine-endopeptidase [Sphaerotilus natans subsp. natans DSM 6575]SIQ25805.1 D-alanyl-D-alanine carboxypeptidase / D-alanyl-D-alanine-endopeptidase (penicillin-binding protein 4) [Sphaerotilus natans]